MSQQDYMSYEYLLQSEIVVRGRFEQDFATYSDRLQEFIDTLFRATYFMGSRQVGAEDGVHYFAVERCHRAPYTLRAVWLLNRVGYYAEAATIIRHLVESFVQIRYFTTNPAALQGHITAAGNKGRIQFKTMFDSLSPGYYEAYYGRALSSISHAGMGFSVLSGMEIADDGSGNIQAPAGCKFDMNYASFSANHSLLLIAGFLNSFPSWFPEFSSLVDAETDQMRRTILDDLKTHRSQLSSMSSDKNDWIQKSEALMGL